ncbi:hypothetical protein JZU71_05615, partial [bacterium]|nr:hypothetical protein [bacterium]
SKTGSSGDKDWLLGELITNLKELRDRTKTGDMSALDEFFTLFVFNDNQFTDTRQCNHTKFTVHQVPVVLGSMPNTKG